MKHVSHCQFFFACVLGSAKHSKNTKNRLTLKDASVPSSCFFLQDGQSQHKSALSCDCSILIIFFEFRTSKEKTETKDLLVNHDTECNNKLWHANQRFLKIRLLRETHYCVVDGICLAGHFFEATILCKNNNAWDVNLLFAQELRLLTHTRVPEHIFEPIHHRDRHPFFKGIGSDLVHLCYKQLGLQGCKRDTMAKENDQTPGDRASAINYISLFLSVIALSLFIFSGLRVTGRCICTTVSRVSESTELTFFAVLYRSVRRRPQGSVYCLCVVLQHQHRGRSRQRWYFKSVYRTGRERVLSRRRYSAQQWSA